MSPTMTAPPMPKQTQPSVMPLPGEAQGAFFDRAWVALAKKFPKANRRTVAIIRLWQQSENDQDLRNEAKERFSPDKYTQQGPRCVFLSHTIPEIAETRDETTGEVNPGREGTEYNRENLQHLVDFANYRIRNAGQFAALSDGHMPTLEEKSTGRPDAEVLGWAGPFYIGLFGNEHPQWAIFCDEWIHNENLSKAEKLQRRSPEVWCKEPIERRTMDPIAMLGSETPRLDSGMNLYSMRADGQEVMRYSMSMAMPNAVNSYVPGSETGKKTNYGANMNDLQQPVPAGPAPDTNSETPDENKALVDAIIDALGGLMPSIVEKVSMAMRQGSGNDPDAVPSDNENQDTEPVEGKEAVPRGIDSPEGDGMAKQAPGQNAPPTPAPAATPGAPAATGGQPAAVAPAPPLDDKHAQYAAMSPECGAAYAAGHQSGCMKGRPMTYSKVSEDPEFVAMAEAHKAALTRIHDLEMLQRDKERYSKVHAIVTNHVVCAEDEIKAKEDEILTDILPVSDAEFDRYCKALSQAPVREKEVTNFELYIDPTDTQTENYSRAHGLTVRASKEDIDRYTRQAADMVVTKRRRGETTDIDTEMKTIFLANGLPDPTLVGPKAA